MSHKAQALVPYEPDNKEFWERHWILSKLVDLLKIRGANVGSGEKLRVILTMDDGKPTLFLQGEELEKLHTLISELSDFALDEEVEFIDELLARVS